MTVYEEPEMRPEEILIHRTSGTECEGFDPPTVQEVQTSCNATAGDIFTTQQARSAGALAAKYLCPKSEIVLGIIGAGHRAEEQLEAIAREFILSTVKIWDADAGRAEAFRQKYCQYPIEICNPKKTCHCDLLVTTTPSRRRVVKARWVHAGTHINAMGADEPGKGELDPTLIAVGKVFVSDRERAIHAGEINVPVAKGFFSPDRIAGTLGEVVLGEKGRTSDTEITIFDSAGCGPGTWQSLQIP
ncbi:MAG: hypothetical protein LUQ66_08695 [Methanoregula sp.]|nr:hypothetical protein [Methanoregula sp.]